MKYILMMFGDQASMVEMRPREWIVEMIQFMEQIGDELAKSGELVSSMGLADPSQARTVRISGGIPVPTDGPFAESKESLAGFWVVDVENEARAIEIVERVVAFTEGPMEIRQVADAPPEEYTSG